MKPIYFLLIVTLALQLAGCAQSQETPKNLTFTYLETTITLGAPAEGILEALGEPLSYTQEASCAFVGLDKTYYYGSFYLTTCPSETGDRINGLWFADDTVQTQEGLAIGDDLTKVEQLLGQEGFNGRNAWILEQGNGTLTVLIEDGKVSAIRYEIPME